MVGRTSVRADGPLYGLRDPGKGGRAVAEPDIGAMLEDRVKLQTLITKPRNEAWPESGPLTFPHALQIGPDSDVLLPTWCRACVSLPRKNQKSSPA